MSLMCYYYQTYLAHGGLNARNDIASVVIFFDQNLFHRAVFEYLGTPSLRASRIGVGQT